jgi:hypothetical protein
MKKVVESVMPAGLVSVENPRQLVHNKNDSKKIGISRSFLLFTYFYATRRFDYD